MAAMRDTRPTYSYVWWDTAKLNNINYDRYVHSGGNDLYDSNYSYDSPGNLYYGATLPNSRH